MTLDGGARIVVLAKPPHVGRSKSRLAADVGAGAAARLARAMLRDTWEEISSLVSSRPGTELLLAISGEPRDYPMMLPEPAIVRQAEGDLYALVACCEQGGERVGELFGEFELDGIAPPARREGLVGALDAHGREHRDGRAGVVVTDYFSVKVHKNQNIHVTVLDDALLERFNAFVADHRRLCHRRKARA